MKRLIGLLMGGLLLLPLHAGARQAPRPVWTDVNRLAMLGHVAEAHVEASTRKSGAWSPEVVVSLTTAGDHMVSRPEPWSLSSRRPAGTLGVTVAPLRVRGRGGLVSVFDLDMGYGASGGASGTALQVSVLKVGFSF